MKRVYISGNTTGNDRAEVQSKFEEAEKSLKDLGLFPINPLKNGLPNTASWDDHMVKDIEMLLTCSAILLLPDWNTSPGARIEAFVANEKKMDRLFLTDQESL